MDHEWWSHGKHELCFCVFSSVSSSKSIIPLNSLFLHVPKILLSIHNHKYLLFFHQAFTFSYYHLKWVKSCWLCFWIHCVPHLWTFVVILVIFCCYLGIVCSLKILFFIWWDTSVWPLLSWCDIAIHAWS